MKLHDLKSKRLDRLVARIDYDAPAEEFEIAVEALISALFAKRI